MVRFTVLASGSKGNSTVVSGGRTRILVDAGLSCRELFRRMRLAEEVSAGRHPFDRFESELRLGDHDGLQELDHHLQHLDIEHQLLERGRESSFLPSRGVVDEVAVSQDRAIRRSR